MDTETKIYALLCICALLFMLGVCKAAEANITYKLTPEYAEAYKTERCENAGGNFSNNICNWDTDK